MTDYMEELGFHAHGKGIDTIYICMISYTTMLIIEGEKNERTGYVEYCFYKQTDRNKRMYRKVYREHCSVRSMYFHVKNYMDWLKKQKKY